MPEKAFALKAKAPDSQSRAFNYSLIILRHGKYTTFSKGEPAEARPDHDRRTNTTTLRKKRQRIITYELACKWNSSTENIMVLNEIL